MKSRDQVSSINHYIFRLHEENEFLVKTVHKQLYYRIIIYLPSSHYENFSGLAGGHKQLALLYWPFIH